jgi:beta-phosphoglucomutase-like phosphatase (HAD superfamily)
MTNGERLARIEALLESNAKSDGEFRADIRKAIEEMRAEAKAHREKTDADEEELSALKNKGAGILIGVAIAAGALGASAAQMLKWLGNLLT